MLFVIVSFLPAPTLTAQVVSNNRSNTDPNSTSSDCPTGPQRDLLDRTWCDLDLEFEERETLRSEPPRRSNVELSKMQVIVEQTSIGLIHQNWSKIAANISRKQ